MSAHHRSGSVEEARRSPRERYPVGVRSQPVGQSPEKQSDQRLTFRAPRASIWITACGVHRGGCDPARRLHAQKQVPTAGGRCVGVLVGGVLGACRGCWPAGSGVRVGVVGGGAGAGVMRAPGAARLRVLGGGVPMALADAGPKVLVGAVFGCWTAGVVMVLGCGAEGCWPTTCWERRAAGCLGCRGSTGRRGAGRWSAEC